MWAVNNERENKNDMARFEHLNDQLRKTTNVKRILQLYKAECKAKRRKRWLTRIYCRYSYLRRKKEMKAVVSAESFV